MFLCWKRMARPRFKLRERRGEGGRGQLMDGVAQRGSEVRRALRKLIGHSVHIHFLLLAYSWAWRQSDRVEAGCIFFFFLCPEIPGQWKASEIRTFFTFPETLFPSCKGKCWRFHFTHSCMHAFLLPLLLVFPLLLLLHHHYLHMWIGCPRKRYAGHIHKTRKDPPWAWITDN